MSFPQAYLVAAALLLVALSAHAKVWNIEYEDQLEQSFRDAKDRVIVIFFYSAKCPYCQKMQPVVHKLADTMKGVWFVRVEVNDLRHIADKYGVSKVPTFIFLKQGRMLGSFSEANPDKLKDVVKEYAFA